MKLRCEKQRKSHLERASVVLCINSFLVDHVLSYPRQGTAERTLKGVGF